MGLATGPMSLVMIREMNIKRGSRGKESDFFSSRRSSNKPLTVSSIDVVEVPAAFFAVQMYRPSSSLTTPVRLKTPAECRTGMSLPSFDQEITGSGMPVALQ